MSDVTPSVQGKERFHMCRSFILTTTALIGLGPVAQAAPVDLLSLGLELGTPRYEALGGVGFFEPFLDEFAADFTSGLSVSGFPGSEVTFFYSSTGPNNVAISYDGLTLDSYDITQVGFTTNSLEFLIARDPLSVAIGNLGNDALVQVTSAAFNFAGISDPLVVFRGAGAADYDIDVSLQALAQIPLPAGAVLFGTALAGLGVMRRRQQR